MRTFPQRMSEIPRLRTLTLARMPNMVPPSSTVQWGTLFVLYISTLAAGCCPALGVCVCGQACKAPSLLFRDTPRLTLYTAACMAT